MSTVENRLEYFDLAQCENKVMKVTESEKGVYSSHLSMNLVWTESTVWSAIGQWQPLTWGPGVNSAPDINVCVWGPLIREVGVMFSDSVIEL